MKTYLQTVKEIIDSKEDPNDHDKCPLTLSVIPNYMGINLCSVEAISWTRQDDGQLTNLTIHFIPSN